MLERDSAMTIQVNDVLRFQNNVVRITAIGEKNCLIVPIHGPMDAGNENAWPIRLIMDCWRVVAWWDGTKIVPRSQKEAGS